MVILMVRRRDKEAKRFMGHDLNQFKSLEVSMYIFRFLYRLGSLSPTLNLLYKILFQGCIFNHFPPNFQIPPKIKSIPTSYNTALDGIFYHSKRFFCRSGNCQIKLNFFLFQASKLRLDAQVRIKPSVDHVDKYARKS